jgi:hypothetical protein
MERIIYKQKSYVITTMNKDVFLSHGEECMYGRTKNIQYAVKIWPKEKAQIVLERMLENNPITDLTELMEIITTYSIVEKDIVRDRSD